MAVNGGLMRGLKANSRMVEVQAVFEREARTAAEYRMWSIRDEYPAMQRVVDGRPGGAALAVEVWSVTPEALVKIFEGEPPELSLGWVYLEDGSRVLGVIAEAAVTAGEKEITSYGGWRAYIDEERIQR